MKHEWKKHEKPLYLPGLTPEIINIPELNFFTITGEGNPNSEIFQKNVATLYALSYKLRMSYKWESPPENYYEYSVYPLEGVWDIADKSKHVEGQLDKDNLSYMIMIRQPDFITHELAKKVIQIVSTKKPSLITERVAFSKISEGKCIQMMHLGSYNNENITFNIMETYAKSIGVKRKSKKHREIYISDPRKTKAEKLKTILRFKVEEI